MPKPLICSECGAEVVSERGLPRATPLARKRPMSIAPSAVPCQHCGQAILTGAKEWLDMTSRERLGVYAEFFLFQGLFAGQIIAFVAGLLATLFLGYQGALKVALAVWLLWIFAVIFFVRQGVKESIQRTS